MAILDRIEIPTSALLHKSWYATYPGPDVIREIKEHIATTGRPYFWRGHTHTEPPKGARIKYIGEFDLPERYRSTHYRAPCPCCSPFYPKYWKAGKIAWFPDEGVIRLIGPDCYRKLNPEGHDEALATFRAEQQREKDISYLHENMHIVSQLAAIASELMPTAVAVDEFSDTLRQRLNGILRIDLWREVKDDGMLRLSIQRKETRQRADGSQYQQEAYDFLDYAPIEGHAILAPTLQRLSPRLRTICGHLEELLAYQAPESDNPNADKKRRKAAKQLGDCVKKVKDIATDIADIRKFASITTTATLRRWSEQKGSPVRIYAERSDNSVYIGLSREEKMRIALAPSFDIALPEIPHLGETSL